MRQTTLSTENIICRIVLLIALLPALALLGCTDSATGPGEGGAVTFEGRVTGSSETQSQALALHQAEENVEEATVTGKELDEDGRANEAPEEATSDEEGMYSLRIENAGRIMLLEAVKGSFTTSVVAYNNREDEGIVAVAPMTVETEAEARVYQEAKTDDPEGEGAVTPADASLFVTSNLAAALNAGTTTEAEIAAALIARKEAVDAYLAEHASGSAGIEARHEAYLDAYATLHERLYAATSAQGEAEAFQTFQGAFFDVYTETDVSAEMSARAEHIAKSALLTFYASSDSKAWFELEKQASIQTAMAVAAAVEASFDAAGKAASASTLADARISLMAALRAASSTQALNQARAEYEAQVHAELAEALDVSTEIIATARTATSAAKTSLEAALATAGSARAIVDAHTAFYETAEAAIASSLEASTSGNVDFGASVIVLLTIR